MEPKFDFKFPQKRPNLTEAVRLCATSEVKMEARSEFLGKFCTKYCFALLWDAV